MPANRRIFIASATEAKPVAMAVAQALAGDGFQPVRWWETFGPGDIPADRLIEVVNSVVGAVFIARASDKTWYRGKEVGTPRANVILELGMSLQALGRKRAIMVTDDQTTLPSDLAGVTYLPAVDDSSTIAEQVVKHFKQEIAATPPRSTNVDVLPIEVDPQVAEAALRSPVTMGWHQRALYLGTEGARGWLSMSRQPNYQIGVFSRLRAMLLDMTRGVEANSFVSLGPGDGDLDREIVLNLSNPTLLYFPVDISEGLLFSAGLALGPFVEVPFGVLSDFEDRIPFISSRLARRVAQPVMFSLLGNTLGNLDKFESTFIRQIQQMMTRGDTLLVHVTIARPPWTYRSLPIDASQHSTERRRFFAQGLSRQSGVPLEDILTEYESRVKHKDGRSDVKPGTLALDYYDDKSGFIIQHIRWYQWDTLLKWVADLPAFDLVREQSFYYPGEERGEGVALFQRQ